MFYVYVLYSKNYNRQYVGMSQNVEERLTSHNKGEVTSTRPYRPWIILHKEEFESRYEARNREKYLKSGAGRRWRKNNMGM